MPWNEPGKKKDSEGKRDPWKEDSGSSGSGPSSFDLDKLIRDWLKKLKKTNFSNGSHGGGLSYWIAIVVIIGAWLASGFYVVGTGHRGVVLRFGALAQVTQPGPHWHLPYPLAYVEMVDIGQIRSTQLKEELLTKGDDLIDVDVTAQYRVINPAHYLFSVRHADQLLRESMESIVRSEVAKRSMKEMLGSQQTNLAMMIQNRLEKRMHFYHTGQQVLKVSFQSVQPPKAVRTAFQAADKARATEAQDREQAQNYEMSLLSKAKTKAAQMISNAEAYKIQAVNLALGRTARFNSALKAYLLNPKIMKERMYFEVWQTMLQHNDKVFLGPGAAKNKNNLSFSLGVPMKNRSQPSLSQPSEAGSHALSVKNDQSHSLDSQTSRLLIQHQLPLTIPKTISKGLS